MKTFTQYTMDDYLFKLSCARIQFMAIDNTHTKYLKGTDKKVWTRYKEELETQEKNLGFINQCGVKAGERFEAPVNKNIARSQRLADEAQKNKK